MNTKYPVDSSFLTKYYRSSVLHNSIRPYQGVTLIELVITIFIIGLLVAMIIPRLDNTDRLFDKEVKRCHLLIKEIARLALTSAKPLALNVDEQNNEYYISILKDKWTEIKKNTFLKRKTVPRTIKIELNSFSQLLQEENKILVQKVVFTPIGEIQPFELKFIGKKYTSVIFLDENNQIKKKTQPR